MNELLIIFICMIAWFVFKFNFHWCISFKVSDIDYYVKAKKNGMLFDVGSGHKYKIYEINGKKVSFMRI